MPPAARELLAGVREALPRARWVDPGQMHLTLRFLGEVSEGRVDELAVALGLVDGAPCEVAVEGVGHFGRPARVLWAALAPEAPLQALAQRVEAAVQAAGFPAAEHPFRPHVTLARLRSTPPHRVRAFLERHASLRSAPFPVDRFDLVRSERTEAGAVHVLLRTYPLRASGGGEAPPEPGPTVS